MHNTFKKAPTLNHTFRYLYDKQSFDGLVCTLNKMFINNLTLKMIFKSTPFSSKLIKNTRGYLLKKLMIICLKWTQGHQNLFIMVFFNVIVTYTIISFYTFRLDIIVSIPSFPNQFLQIWLQSIGLNFPDWCQLTNRGRFLVLMLFKNYWVMVSTKRNIHIGHPTLIKSRVQWK